MTARGEQGYTKNVYTRVIHLDSCTRKASGLPWSSIPRQRDDRACSFCLPDGLPAEPRHQVRSILPTIWVCACDGFRAWTTEAEASEHLPTPTTPNGASS